MKATTRRGRKTERFGAAAAALVLMWPGWGWGHGDLPEQVLAVTRQIEKNPRDAELYLKRGELHRAYRDWDAANADYDMALSLDPNLTIVDLARGRLFLESDWPHSAKVCLDRFLRQHEGHGVALATRARVLRKLGQNEEAASDFSSAIRAVREPGPDLFIERAQALAETGPKGLDEAVTGLDEGIRKLGPVVTLQLHAIDLEIRRGEIDRALERLERVAARSPRKETWLARRGEILQGANRVAEAREAYEASLKAIEQLPPSRARVPAMVELQKRVRAALDALSRSSEPEPPARDQPGG